MVYKLLLKHDPRGILVFFALRVGHNKHVGNTQISNSNCKNYTIYLGKVLKVNWRSEYNKLWTMIGILYYSLGILLIYRDIIRSQVDVYLMKNKAHVHKHI